MVELTWPLRVLCSTAGIPIPTLGTWRARYGLRLDAETHSASKARYGFQDLLRVTLTAELVGLEVTARRACELVNEHFDLIAEIDAGLPERRRAPGPFLVVDRPGIPFREGVTLVKLPGELLDALLWMGSGGAKLTIDFSAIANRVSRSLSSGHRREEAEEDESLPIEVRTRDTWDRSPAIRAEFEDFDHYLAYRRADERGQIWFE